MALSVFGRGQGVDLVDRADRLDVLGVGLVVGFDLLDQSSSLPARLMKAYFSVAARTRS
jgi:hypothetical protein